MRAAIERLERSPYWVWTAMDPTSKLLVVIDVGTRTLAACIAAKHQKCLICPSTSQNYTTHQV